MRSKQVILNKLNLPVELIHIIQDFAFHRIKKIPKNDERYHLIIPPKLYFGDSATIDLGHKMRKNYYLSYINSTIIFWHSDPAYWIEPETITE